MAHRELIRIVCAADALAHAVSMESPGEAHLATLEEEGRLPVELSHEEILLIVAELKTEVGESQAFLRVS